VLVPPAELLVFDASLLEARILSRCCWVAFGPVGGGSEVVGDGWLAPVLMLS
jgi:hypothetical protein